MKPLSRRLLLPNGFIGEAERLMTVWHVARQIRLGNLFQRFLGNLKGGLN